VDAYVPSDYVPGEAQKIDLHRRLALAESEDELRELHAAAEDRFGPPPEPVENLFSIQEAKLKLARLGADYLVFRGGRAVLGPLVLGSAELRELRRIVDTAVYSSANNEVTLRGDGFNRALELVDAILDLRLAA
jgi:transcription-repair coupling factor (superfamily II helicase)